MSTYTVQAVEKIRDYQKDQTKPPVPIYKLLLANGDGQTREAELFDNTGINPQPGQSVDGEVESGQYGLKFKPERKGGGGGGRPGKSPEERASIEAQTALKSAVEYAAAFSSPPDATAVLTTATGFYEWLKAQRA